METGDVGVLAEGAVVKSSHLQGCPVLYERKSIVVPLPTGASLMNVVMNCASRKPSSLLRSYSYVHDSKLRQPCQFTAAMRTTLWVTTVMAYRHLYLTVTSKPPGFPLTSSVNIWFFLRKSHDG